MKLEKKHVLAYLDDGLKCSLEGVYVDGTEYDDNPVLEVFMIDGVDSTSIKLYPNNIVANLCDFDEVFLILRNLSNLTKEIEHKGEKFVPLLKLVDPDNTDLAKMRVESYNPFPQVGLQHDYYRVIHEKLGEIISINPRNIKVLPYHLIEKLLEWKFDIFGLLDRSLAVDKTTIQ